MQQALALSGLYGKQVMRLARQETSVIRKEKGQYCVRSPNNPDWNGGCYDSEAKAKDRLKQVEFFKSKGAANIVLRVALRYFDP